MKILLDHHQPFLLAHGGVQTQIEQTRQALEDAGVEVEWLRWWDASQGGDLIHFFGRPPASHIRFAQQKGVRFVFSDVMGGLGARRAAVLRLQWLVTRTLEKLAPNIVLSRMDWESYRITDGCIALTEWEAHLMRWMFRAAPSRVHVISNGVEPEFFRSMPAQRGSWLVTTASILPVKRIVETAAAAVAAGTPYWVIGKPFSENDGYYLEFRRLQAAHPEVLRYEGPIVERARLAQVYREARGFVLLSRWESLSISALEATACECPLLLSDLPWARTVFGEAATYCPITNSATTTAASLRSFYDAAPQLPSPPKPLSWPDVAGKLKILYESLASTSR